MKMVDETSITGNWIQIEEAIARFESDRQRGVVALADYCPPIEDPHFSVFLRELIRVELELLWNEGHHKTLADYIDQFPMLKDEPKSLELIGFDEYRLRCTIETVSPDDFARRYGINTNTWPRDVDPTVTQLVNQMAIIQPDDKTKEPLSEFPDPGTVFSSFHIVSELGRGAFARVYLAEQSDLACRHVVLKISTQLQDESQTLAKLQHTNIIPIYSSHQVDGFQAICMPYFGRTTLQDVLKQVNQEPSAVLSGLGVVSTIRERRMDSTVLSGGPVNTLPPMGPAPSRPEITLDYLSGLNQTQLACWIVSELADGLAHAHTRGILHCDIKPANILLSDEGRPMLFDFNLAMLSSRRQSEILGGTLKYMPPEQLESLAGEATMIDHRADIYALGLILYEIVTGRLPYTLERKPFAEQVAQMRSLAQQEIDFTIIHDLALRAILKKCLAKQPIHRYSSADQLSDDLQRHLKHQPLQWAKEPLSSQRVQKWFHRNSWVTSTAFLACVATGCLLLALAGWYQSRYQRARTDATIATKNLSDSLALLGPDLISPDPDPHQLAADVQLAEQRLSPWQLHEQDAIFHEQVTRYLNVEQAIAVQRDVTTAMMQIAHGRLLLQQPKDSLHWNQRAISIAPTEQLKWLATWQRIRLLRVDGQPQLAKSLEQQLGDPPTSALDRLWRAREAFADHQFAEALKLLAIDDPELRRRADYWHLRASCFVELGQWHEAITAASTALSHQSSQNDHLYALRARAFLGLNQFSQAQEDLDQAIKLKPRQGSYYISRAIAHAGEKRWGDAVADLDHAEKHWPEHTRIFFMRARYRQMLGDTAGAKLDRENGLKREPSDEISWISRGVALIPLDPKRAVADFDRAIQLNPRSHTARQNKAHVYADYLQQAEPAQQELDTVIAQMPNDAMARGGRAILLARQGKRAAALNDVEVMLKQPVLSPLLKYQAAGVYALSAKKHPEDRQRAIQLLAQALKEDLDTRLTENDPDIAPLRQDPVVQELLRAARQLEQLSQ